MRRAVMLASVLLWMAGAARAQEGFSPCTIGSPGATLVRDSTHEDWRAILGQYHRLAEAMRREDIDSLTALYSPEMTVLMNDGQTWSYERSVAYSRAGFAQVEETHHISNKILRLVSCGNSVTATVLQTWVRTQAASGRPRRFHTTAVQDESWVRGAGGWKRRYIAEVHPGPVFVDGKPVDASRPFDPDAPPFDPHAREAPRPAADSLYSAIVRTGPGSAERHLGALVQSPRFYVTEQTLNALGYRLLSERRVSEAVEVFRLAVAKYPQSANVYDSLGEAYAVQGDRERALANYQRSLELNPGNTNAAQALQRLRAATP